MIGFEFPMAPWVRDRKMQLGTAIQIIHSPQVRNRKIQLSASIRIIHSFHRTISTTAVRYRDSNYSHSPSYEGTKSKNASTHIGLNYAHPHMVQNRKMQLATAIQIIHIHMVQNRKMQLSDAIQFSTVPSVRNRKCS